MRRVTSNLELGFKALAFAALLVGVRALLWELGVEGMSPTAVSSGIIAGGIFVVGLLVAGTLSDYRDAERAPTDIAAGLYSILREAESMHAVWRTPDLTELRRRLIAVVTRCGRTSTQATRAPAKRRSRVSRRPSKFWMNPTCRRTTSSGCAPSRRVFGDPYLRVYHIQREVFLPSAFAMIMTFVSLIMILLLLTNFDGMTESLVAVGFISFFFLGLLLLLNTIATPFKVGVERTDDDVSLFLLHEFVVQAQASEAGETVVEDVEAQAEEVEEQLVEVEEQTTDATKAAEQATDRLTPDA